jgi:hypothetical protein
MMERLGRSSRTHAKGGLPARTRDLPADDVPWPI